MPLDFRSTVIVDTVAIRKDELVCDSFLLMTSRAALFLARVAAALT